MTDDPRYQIPITKSGGVLTVDLRNKYYLSPGLIDCHVHVTAVPGVGNVKDAVRTSFL